jgi:hypothetical protein
MWTRLTALTIAISLSFVGWIWARGTVPAFVGRYEDIRYLDEQGRQDGGFTFARLVYNGHIRGYYKNWYTDYPKGDRQLIGILSRLTGVDIASEELAIPVRHPDLFNYPFVYSVEGGQMSLEWSDARILREYLDRGGFWMIDDFWGPAEWSQFALAIEKVFPDRSIVDVPLAHPVFHSFYDIDEIVQVPNIGYAYCHVNCSTVEQGGDRPSVRGIFDDQNNLRVLINFNTDLMDAAEWADDPRYPHRFSDYSYRSFSNAVIYSLTH